MQKMGELWIAVINTIPSAPLTLNLSLQHGDTSPSPIPPPLPLPVDPFLFYPLPVDPFLDQTQQANWCQMISP